MNYGTQLVNEIRKIGGYNGPAPKTVAVSMGHIDLAADIVAADSFSCSCREIRMRVPVLADADTAVLQQWARDLCARITYLMEQLGPLEIDTAGKQVLIRSKSPEKRDDSRTFYEILLQSQGAGLFTLRRYRRETPRDARKQVDLRMTHEAVEKLGDDLVATIPTLP